MAQYASYRWLKTRKNRLNTQCEVKDMDEIYETQPERTDLPLVVVPVIIESMIESFEKNFELFKDIARVRMYKDFTLDEDTIVARCAEADAIIVIGFHCADSILDRLNVKCYAFGGTGVASYIDLNKAKERGIRVCNVVHYGDHAVAEHTIALLMELARQVGKLDRQVKEGNWMVSTAMNCTVRSLASSALAASAKPWHVSPELLAWTCPHGTPTFPSGCSPT